MMLLLTFLPTGMSAQQHIEQAFRQFIKHTKVSKFESKGNEPGQKGFKSYLNTYTFTLPATAAASIETLNSAFAADEEASYNTIRVTDGERKGVVSLTMANRSAVILGENYANLTLMCYADPKDSTMRYAYAVEWEPAKDGQIRGRLVSSYSRRPKDRRETTDERILRFSFPTLTSALGSTDRQSHVIQHIDKALNENDLKQLRKRWSSKSGKIMEDVNKMIREGKAQYVINDTLTLPAEMDAATWLAQFNALKNLVLKAPDSNTTSYYVSTIYDLCRNAGTLDADARLIVQKELRNMIDAVKDQFLKDLLEQSVGNIGKTAAQP